MRSSDISPIIARISVFSANPLDISGLSPNTDESMSKNVAIVGATGTVGQEFLVVLAERKFPINHLRLLASGRSAGKEVTFCGKTYVIEELTKESFAGIDIAFFSAGGGISKEFAPAAVAAGAV